MQIGAQPQGKLRHERLGPAVHIATRIGVTGRDRTDVDDRAFLGDQRRQQPVGDRDQSSDVGFDHLVPLFEAGFLRRRRAERQSRVVDKQIDLPERFGQGGQRRLDCIGIAHVERRGEYLLLAEFVDQLLQPVGTAARRHDTPARICESPHGCGSEAGGRAGNHCGLCHDNLSSRMFIQCLTCSEVPLWMWVRQPMFAVASMAGSPDSRASTLFFSNRCDSSG